MKQTLRKLEKIKNEIEYLDVFDWLTIAALPPIAPFKVMEIDKPAIVLSAAIMGGLFYYNSDGFETFNNEIISEVPFEHRESQLLENTRTITERLGRYEKVRDYLGNDFLDLGFFASYALTPIPIEKGILYFSDREDKEMTREYKLGDVNVTFKSGEEFKCGIEIIISEYFGEKKINYYMKNYAGTQGYNDYCELAFGDKNTDYGAEHPDLGWIKKELDSELDKLKR